MMTLIKEGGLVGAVVLLLLIAMLNNRRKNKKLQKLLKAEAVDARSAKLDAAVDAARLAIDGDAFGREAAELGITAETLGPARFRTHGSGRVRMSAT